MGVPCHPYLILALPSGKQPPIHTAHVQSQHVAGQVGISICLPCPNTIASAQACQLTSLLYMECVFV